jgi:hypothetical protein
LEPESAAGGDLKSANAGVKVVPVRVVPPPEDVRDDTTTGVVGVGWGVVVAGTVDGNAVCCVILLYTLAGIVMWSL